MLSKSNNISLHKINSKSQFILITVSWKGHKFVVLIKRW